jgi:hypothetical protein
MTDEEKKKLVSEILSYLLKNPEAGDTLEGIARFWTTQQRIDLMLSDVQEVLQTLVEEDLLKERFLRAPDGSSTQRYYKLNPSRKGDIERRTSTRKPGSSEHKDPGPPSR